MKLLCATLAVFSCAYLDAQSPAESLGFGLGNLPLVTGAQTRSVSAENPTGEKGKGGMAIPDPADPNLPFSYATSDLGQGWKVNPFLKPKAHQTVTLMDVNGPGVIQHIWMATETDWLGNGRASVLRFYWDNESTPSVREGAKPLCRTLHCLHAVI